ncbi:MAG: hypothetical protein HWE22_10550 [Flavobacteriales bacterium]|nr:hypothetical protein [Flavobacteriales bacterium]
MIKRSLTSVLVLCIACVQSFVHAQNQSSQTDYFEGIVEYELTYESLHPIRSSESFVENSPNKKLQFYKGGSFVIESYQNDSLISRSWFDQSSNKNYIHIANSDTIYFYDVKNVDFDIEPPSIEKGDDILQFETQKVTLKLKGKDNSLYAGNKSQLVFYIAPSLPTNPEWYVNFHEFRMNEVFSEVPGIILKEEDIIFEIRKLTKTAVRIEHKSITLDLSIDPTKTLVEI